MKHQFYPGQPVRCVQNGDNRYPLVMRPTLGQRYTVRCYSNVVSYRTGQPVMYLLEIINQKVRYAGTKVRAEAGFPERWFAPVTDISLLETLLKRTPAPGELARVHTIFHPHKRQYEIRKPKRENING